MTVLFVLLLAVQTPETIVSRDISITIPGPLNSAIAPYLHCTVEALNSGVKTHGGGPEVHSRLRSHVVTTCAKKRLRAVKAADESMQREAHHINPKERGAFINSILKSVDSLYETATKFADVPDVDDRMTDAPNN